jgi:SAM-dependent methyltransferase
MPVNATHAMFPDAWHDEQSRQHFIRSLKVHIAQDVMPGNEKLFNGPVQDRFRKEHGRDIKTRKEMREELGKVPFNQVWSAMLRTSQEMLYDTVRPSIERQLPELSQKAKKFSGKHGSLRLDPDLAIPRYHTAVDIHSKPGAYHTNVTDEGDVVAGAEYDRTIHLYFMGQAGPNNDDTGVSTGAWLKQRFPNFKPKRILDMGCTIGHASLPYVDHFPGAEVHAIDVAGPCVRYGYHRSEALGKAVHFSQQNAEHTDFPDGHFDLITSHLMFHETSVKASRAIIKECHRLLSKGGIMLHADALGRGALYDKYFVEWNAHFNAEPYLGTMQDEDWKAISAAGGFDPQTFFEDSAPSAYVSRSDRGEGKGFGQYNVFGAVK